MKKNMKYVCAVLLMLVMLTSTSIPVLASTSGTTGTGTIMVVTKANWLCPGTESITLSNSKVNVSYKSWFLGTRNKSIYPTYKINVRATDNSQNYNKTMSGSSLKLNLKPNKTYRITVTYDFNRTWLTYCNLSNAKMTSNPCWRVKSSYKVSNYY